MAREAKVPDVLSAEDLAAINDALRVLHMAGDKIDAATACGYDCQPHEDYRRHLIERLEAVKANFFKRGAK